MQSLSLRTGYVGIGRKIVYVAFNVGIYQRKVNIQRLTLDVGLNADL
jgi:hypothetical protein